ncbi:MAG TPA: DUF1573 domain-containing protein [Gemmataceae bacterium]|nr:DUF1573 domain-containing protein [Gemmataceae bacterium]
MRKLVLAAIGILALASAAAPQQVVTGWAGKLFGAAAPDHKVPAGHDFGFVPKGAQLKHSFPLTNIYAVPLQIVTSVSCGCVTVAPNPQILQPRESGALELNMDTLKWSYGHKQVSVYVTVMNAQYSSTTTLVITANSRADITLDPGVAPFGVVPKGQQVTRDVIVRYAGQLPFQITGVAPGDSAPFTAAVKEMYRQPGRVEYRVSLTLKPDAPPGPLKGDLHLTTTDPATPLLPIPYDALVQAALTASPEVTRFGTIRAGEPAVRKLIVRSNGRPIRILGVDGQDASLVVEFRPEPNAVQILTLKLQPSQPGPFQRTLTIKTDLDGATVNARVEAMVQ